MVSTPQQLQLFRSKVAVVGSGGLGGYILEQLARLGVGQIVAIDDDVFEENNLNRQLLSTPAHLGRVKVEVAAERIADVNPAVTLTPVRARFGRDNGAALLAGCRLRGRRRRQRQRPAGTWRGLQRAGDCRWSTAPSPAGTAMSPPSIPGNVPCRPSTATSREARGSSSSSAIPPSPRRWRPVSRSPKSARCCSARGGCCAIASWPSICSTWRSTRFPFKRAPCRPLRSRKQS